jgi:hypothetical protein
MVFPDQKKRLAAAIRLFTTLTIGIWNYITAAEQWWSGGL